MMVVLTSIGTSDRPSGTTFITPYVPPTRPVRAFIEEFEYERLTWPLDE
jgi:hypothetical protein